MPLFTAADYDEMTVEELKAIATEYGIKGRSGMDKNKLIEAILPLELEYIEDDEPEGEGEEQEVSASEEEGTKDGRDADPDGEIVDGINPRTDLRPSATWRG